MSILSCLQQLVLSVAIIYNRKMPGDVEEEGETKGKATQRREAREAKLARNETDEEEVAEGGVDQEDWNSERTRIRALDSHSFDKTMLGMNTRYVLVAGATFAVHGCVTDGDLAAPTTLREQTGNSRSHGLCYVHRIRTMYKHVSDMKSAMRKQRTPDAGTTLSAEDGRSDDETNSSSSSTNSSSSSDSSSSSGSGLNEDNDGPSPEGASPPQFSRIDSQS
jgi:hypothetical protein